MVLGTSTLKDKSFGIGACLRRPRIAGAEKPATADGPAGSSPTSSRWALETPITRARLGAGRRLSGERCGGCGMIGEEIVRQPPQPAFFNAGPGPTGTHTRKGVKNNSGEERGEAAAQGWTRRLGG